MNERASLAERVLDWMLRRLVVGTPLRQSLMLVFDHVALEGLPAQVVAGGATWRVARVTGELTLRDALVDEAPLIAIVPEGFLPAMDLAGRSYLGRVLQVRPEDVVAALAGRFCEPLVDEELAAAVLDMLDVMRERTPTWSLGNVVSAREVRGVLVSAELGGEERLDRVAEWALLSQWIVGGVPTFRAPRLVALALVEARPRTGAWLAWVLEGGSLSALVAVGALSGGAWGLAVAPTLPQLGQGDRGELRGLVEIAVRDAYGRAPDRTREVLAEAERLAHRAPGFRAAEAARYPLLSSVLVMALHTFIHDADQGKPAEDVAIETLLANLHARAYASPIDLARETSRLARFTRHVTPLPADTPAAAWFTLARDHSARADLCIRRLRRLLPEAPADLAAPATRVLERALRLRDGLNHAFGVTLARDWGAVAANKDLHGPLALHQVSRCLLRRLHDEGRKVLLVVLDGCDLSTFYELMEAIPSQEMVGLTPPPVVNASLREALKDALLVGVAPVPTVTSHARRALFAGEIPGNTALDDTESASANSAGDQTAWMRNNAVLDVPRRLFLKGDLGADGAALRDTLTHGPERLVAVVFNGVDDALSSKETTPLPRWSFEALGGGAWATLKCAVEQDWTVVLTADHGHTPHLSPERKVSPRSQGARFGIEPSVGAISFTFGPLPIKPLYLLTDVGAWHGGQHRGYHGGAGLEEVAVPLAFLGRVGIGQGRLPPPIWWWSDVPSDTRQEPTAHAAPPVYTPAPPPPLAPAAAEPAAPKTPRIPSGIPEGVRAVFEDRPDLLRALEVLAEKKVLSLPQLASALRLPPFLVSGRMGNIQAELARAGQAAPFIEEGENNDRVYHWRPRS